MSAIELAPAYLSADFGEHGGRVDWLSHQDVINWITQLQSQWSWIANLGHNPTHNTWGAITSGLSSATNQLQQADSYRNQGQLDIARNQINAARQALEQLVQSNPWLLPQSAQRRFVEDLKASGKPLEAGLIVANWMSQDMSGAPIRSVVSALLQWELYERGIKERMKSESATLKRLAGEMQTALTGYQEAERTQSHRFDTLHGQILEQSVGQQGAFETSQENREAAWNAQMGEVQEEFTRLKDTYDKHMALAAPVDYWDTKRKRHRNWSIGTFIILVVGMVVAGLFLHWEIQSVGQAVEAAQTASQSSKQAQPVTPTAATSVVQLAATWRIGSLILLATLSFWILRLLVRILLSNMHLENDAAERVTMAKTYLALIRDGSLPKGDNINTILAALFRPTGDGIVKDEGIPPTTLDWFTKLGGK